MLESAAEIVGIAGILVSVALLAITVWALLTGHDLGLQKSADDSESDESGSNSLGGLLRSALTESKLQRLRHEASERNISVVQQAVNIIRDYLESQEISDTDVRFPRGNSPDSDPAPERTSEVNTSIQGMEDYEAQEGALRQIRSE